MEWFILSTTGFAMMLLNFAHIIDAWLHRPAGTMFIGITHWYEDYFFYLTHVTQGAIGRWTVTNLYLTEPFSNTFTWWLNLLLGKITSPLQLPVWTIYDGALVVSLFLYCFVLYTTLRRIFPGSRSLRITAYILALTSTGLFQISKTPDGLQILPYEFFFTYTLSLNRLGGIFNGTWQNILSLIFILLYSDLITAILTTAYRWGKKFTVRLFVCICTTLLLYIANPIAAAIVLGCAGITTVVLCIIQKKLRKFPFAVVILMYITAPLLPLVIRQMEEVKQPFFQQYILFEQTVINPTFLVFVLSMGILSFLLPLGIWPYLKNRTPLRIYGFIYAFVPLILYFSPLPGIFHIQYVRFMHPSAYIFFGAIGAYTLVYGARFCSRLFPRILKPAVLPIVVCLYVGSMAPVLYMEVRDRIGFIRMVSFVNYIQPDTYRGLMALRTKPNGITFTPSPLSLFVPVVSGKPSYVVHRIITPDHERKAGEANAFFLLQWPKTQALRFLQTNAIRYVIVQSTPQVQQTFEEFYSPGLIPIWSSPTLGIFEVPQQ